MLTPWKKTTLLTLILCVTINAQAIDSQPSSIDQTDAAKGPDPTTLGVVPNAKKLGAGIPPFKTSAPIAGNEPSPFKEAISLKKAMEISVLRNWDLLTAGTSVDQNKAQLMIAKEFPNPSVSLSTAKITPNASTSLGSSFLDRSYDTIAAVNQLIELGGKRKWRQLAAKHGILNAEALFLDAERQLKDAVTKAYALVLREDGLVAILLDSEETLAKESKIAKRRLEVGDINASDELQIEIAAERFAADRVVEESNARNARVTLELLLGVKAPLGTIQLSDKFPELIEQLGKGQYPVKGERPDLVAAKANVNQMEANVKLALAGRIPDLTISGQVEHNPNPPAASNSSGFGISLPIPLWNHNQGAIALARAQKAAAEIALNKVCALVISDATQARDTFRATHIKWINYRETVGPKSKAALGAVRYSYEKGNIPLVTLLDAMRNDNDVRTGTSQAANDCTAAAADLEATQPYLKN